MTSQKTDRLPARERQLLKVVNTGLPSDKQSYYEQLRDGLQSESLSVKEHQDWLVLTEQLEILDAQRLQALNELALLKGVSLEVIMQQLVITTPSPYA